VTRIGELRRTLAVTNNRRRLLRSTMYVLVFLRSVRRLLVTAKVFPSSRHSSFTAGKTSNLT
jgi:hypothetical protein